MKKIITAFIFCFLFGECFSQAGEWVWIKGDSIPNQPGNYGVQGVPSPTNNPPALYEPCEWTDLNGNFWLFGGTRDSSTSSLTYADLWKYDPITNEWTWIKGNGLPNSSGNFGTQGVPSINNNPPSRGWGTLAWTDNQGYLWMFGGGLGYRSDLWKYDISTNEWTWMKGPTSGNSPGFYGTLGVPSANNNPHGRGETAVAWKDNLGDLWLFGAQKSGPLYYLNDLWRYNISSNQWTWMKGDSTGNSIGVYGTLGIENSTNTPRARAVYSHWSDNTGKLWLFGGLFTSTSYMEYNDLWRYNPITNNWAWMCGSNFANAVGVYGTKCIPSANNIPGSRTETRACWKDQFGDFWLFGGGGGNFVTIQNDLWKYCVASNQWIWVSGDNYSNPTGNWGSIGIPSPTNKPNGRGGSVAWSDNNGHFYFFGGSTSPALTTYNDLWKYTIDTTCGVCPTLTSIDENNFSNQLLIIPNPTSNELTISNFQFQTGDEIILTDVLGKIIFRKKILSPASDFRLLTSGFSNGLYFLQLKTKEEVLSRKVVVQR